MQQGWHYVFTIMNQDSEIAKVTKEWKDLTQAWTKETRTVIAWDVEWADVSSHVSEVPFTRINIFIQIATAFLFLL